MITITKAALIIHLAEVALFAQRLVHGHRILLASARHIVPQGMGHRCRLKFCHLGTQQYPGGPAFTQGSQGPAMVDLWGEATNRGTRAPCALAFQAFI